MTNRASAVVIQNAITITVMQFDGYVPSGIAGNYVKVDDIRAALSGVGPFLCHYAPIVAK